MPPRTMKGVVAWGVRAGYREWTRENKQRERLLLLQDALAAASAFEEYLSTIGEEVGSVHAVDQGTVLSLAAERIEVSKLSPEDWASVSLTRFAARLSWSPRKGFAAVEPL